MTDRLKKEAEAFGISLTGEMTDGFACYYDMLTEWNGKMNLTAITDPDEVCAKHFLDSLTVLAAYNIPYGARLIDVGTGAGFPGIPLKIVRPDIELTLLDSLSKRLDFLRALSDALGQRNSFVHERAEQLAHDPAHREAYDAVTARAVAALPFLCELCAGFLKIGGVFFAMKGPDADGELEASDNAMRTMGVQHAKTARFEIPGAGIRNILLLKKISQTPTDFPRTNKKMTKTPL